MHFHRHLEVVNACRFCFMCRHLDTVANVTFREADIPRGRALILDRVRMNPELLGHPDYVRTLYDTALSGACREHCVSHYDEVGLVLAARGDIVEAGHAPSEVAALAAILQSQGSPHRPAAACPPADRTAPADLAYLLDAYTAAHHPETARAFLGLARTAGRRVRVVAPERSLGKALLTLGYREAAKAAAETMASVVRGSGIATWVSSSPAAVDALVNDYPTLGVSLDGITVQHTSEVLWEWLRDGALTPTPTGCAAAYLDSDFLCRYLHREAAGRELLSACGYTLKPFGTNPEESYALGEGAVVFDLLRPALAARLGERLVGLMDAPGDLLITPSPYTHHLLSGLAGLERKPLGLELAVAAAFPALEARLP